MGKRGVRECLWVCVWTSAKLPDRSDSACQQGNVLTMWYVYMDVYAVK